MPPKKEVVPTRKSSRLTHESDSDSEGDNIPHTPKPKSRRQSTVPLTERSASKVRSKLEPNEEVKASVRKSRSSMAPSTTASTAKHRAAKSKRNDDANSADSEVSLSKRVKKGETSDREEEEDDNAKKRKRTTPTKPTNAFQQGSARRPRSSSRVKRGNTDEDSAAGVPLGVQDSEIESSDEDVETTRAKIRKQLEGDTADQPPAVVTVSNALKEAALKRLNEEKNKEMPATPQARKTPVRHTVIQQDPQYTYDAAPPMPSSPILTPVRGNSHSSVSHQTIPATPADDSYNTFSHYAPLAASTPAGHSATAYSRPSRQQHVTTPEHRTTSPLYRGVQPQQYYPASSSKLPDPSHNSSFFSSFIKSPPKMQPPPGYSTAINYPPSSMYGEESYQTPPPPKRLATNTFQRLSFSGAEDDGLHERKQADRVLVWKNFVRQIGQWGALAAFICLFILLVIISPNLPFGGVDEVSREAALVHKCLEVVFYKLQVQRGRYECDEAPNLELSADALIDVMKTVVPDEEKEFYVRALNVLQRQNDIVYDQRLDTYNVDSGDIRSMRCRIRFWLYNNWFTLIFLVTAVVAISFAAHTFVRKRKEKQLVVGLVAQVKGILKARADEYQMERLQGGATEKKPYVAIDQLQSHFAEQKGDVRLTHELWARVKGEIERDVRVSVTERNIAGEQLSCWGWSAQGL